ncbi:hypothetical protein JMJ56_20575 [Belnapia sp. T18]|uniref:Uncharacterized protein n=1 Tax=Belnapia arida TaxID=2804533 RepID=A0ABS1U6V4_9PROT|nr:hypothetical protein [Belnapia arida]MBL6080416.1 hypothetical protein [Belnapia arida]
MTGRAAAQGADQHAERAGLTPDESEPVELAEDLPAAADTLVELVATLPAVTWKAPRR